MAGWPSIHAVSFAGLVLAARIAAQQPTPPRAAAVAVPRLQRLTTPNVTGLSLDSARRILTVRKLISQVETRPRGLRANTQDVVTQQSPAAGQALPANRTVVVEVTIVMPNLIGQNISQAREVLATRGIRVNYATQEAVGTTSDVIIRQNPPAGAVVSTSLTADLTGAIEVIRVPDVRGLMVPAANNRLARFVVRQEAAPNAATPNTIFGQDPAPLTPARPGATVTVYVAQAIQPVQRPVPNVVGRPLQDATAILTRSGFLAGAITDDDDANVASGVVVNQSPAGGQQADTGTRVGLTVRTNRVRVPAVLTLTEADAKQLMAASSLRVANAEPRDDAATPGTVIDQSPAPRTLVERGSDVSIVVARQAAATTPPRPPPPPGVVVPDIVGLSRAQAKAVALRAGFVLVVAPGQSARDADIVIAQAPLARTTVSTGSLVLMARFSLVPPPRPMWILWVALGVAVIVTAAVLIARKPPTPPTPQVAPPPITYAARAKPPSFSITEGKASRGLELSLSMQNDPGVQAVVQPSKAP